MFTLEDLRTQLAAMLLSPSLADMLEGLPFVAILDSMTPHERRAPDVFASQPSRVSRVSRGAGRTEEEVRELLRRFGQLTSLLHDSPGRRR